MRNSQLYKMRHSAAHIMAQAVVEMFPEAKYTIGPPVENGFYYDFDLPRNLTPEDLQALEKRMRQIIAGKHDFVKKVVTADEARKIFKEQPYKLELIDGLEKGGFDEYGNPLKEKPEISIYQHDVFVDLCRGPHVANTKELKPDAVKLMSVAGAYWRGDEHNKMLQRIYGTAWENAQQLKDYLLQLEEAKKRDHRKLGKELDIFFFDEEIGPGLPLFTPNGGVLVEELEKLAKEMEDQAGYLRVRTPHLTKEDLFIHSGHLPYYAESMYPPMELEGVKYYVKPMNCPMHHKIFASQPALVPRPAHPPGGIRHGLPLREVRRALRPDARALDADERRPHVRHGRAVRGRVPWGGKPVPQVLCPVRHPEVRHAPEPAQQGRPREEIRRQ